MSSYQEFSKRRSSGTGNELLRRFVRSSRGHFVEKKAKKNNNKDTLCLSSEPHFAPLGSRIDSQCKGSVWSHRQKKKGKLRNSQ